MNSRITGKFDGILGLGFTSISIDGATTVLENAVKTDLLDEPVFAFYLGDNADGELTIGGTDESKYEGELHMVDLTAATYWQIALDGITLSDGESVVKATSAIVDVSIVIANGWRRN